MSDNNTPGSGVSVIARARPITPKNNLMAFASVKIADCFVVDNIKVVAGREGLFVDMPSAQDSGGKYHDVCFPTTPEFRKSINDAVLSAYSAALDKMQEVGKAHEAARPSVKERLQEGAKTAAAQGASAPPQDVAKRTQEAR